MPIINKVIAGLLWPLLLLAVCGCAASSMPAATNAQQALAEKSDPARFPPTRGPVNATVTLSLYEDYQWVYCARLEPTLQQVLEEYPDTVQLVVRPFPSVDNQSSLLAASAALAAHAQGYFWEIREQLFLAEGALSVGDLRDMAEQVGIDPPRFFRDLSSDKIQGRLAQCINAGIDQGVQWTPSIFVNQTPLESLRIEDIRQAIRQAAEQ